MTTTEGTSGPDPLDDPDIPDSDALYRRLSDSGPSMVAVDLETGERRPTSGAFKPDDDGVSVFRRGLWGWLGAHRVAFPVTGGRSARRVAKAKRGGM